MYLMWQADDARDTWATRITAACAAWQRRFGTAATEIMLHPTIPREPLALQFPHVRITANAMVQPSLLYVGGETVTPFIEDTEITVQHANPQAVL